MNWQTSPTRQYLVLHAVVKTRDPCKEEVIQISSVNDLSGSWRWGLLFLVYWLAVMLDRYSSDDSWRQMKLVIAATSLRKRRSKELRSECRKADEFTYNQILQVKIIRLSWRLLFIPRPLPCQPKIGRILMKPFCLCDEWWKLGNPWISLFVAFPTS